MIVLVRFREHQHAKCRFLSVYSALYIGVLWLLQQWNGISYYFTTAVQYDRGGRYSYSLTTFDPSGKLGQVERAMEAAQQGTPIVAMIYTNSSDSGIIMAAPQLLPNIFTIDDGTTRFSAVAPNIMISHSGLSSDGRVLVAAAQKLAVQHEYTFDESISINILLEELSLLYQEYTMKVAARPFGASLIVAYVPLSADSNPNQPAIYRIDPSGNVESLEQYAIVNGKNVVKTDLSSDLKVLSNESRSGNMTIAECRTKLVASLLQSLQQQSKQSGNNDDTYHREEFTILSATLSRGRNEGVFQKETHNP